MTKPFSGGLRVSQTREPKRQKPRANGSRSARLKFRQSHSKRKLRDLDWCCDWVDGANCAEAKKETAGGGTSLKPGGGWWAFLCIFFRGASVCVCCWCWFWGSGTQNDGEHHFCSMNVVYVLLCKKGLKKDVPPNQKKSLKSIVFKLFFLGSHRCASLIPAHLWSPLFRSNLHSPQTNLAPENGWLEYEWFFGCFLYQVPLFSLTLLEKKYISLLLYGFLCLNLRYLSFICLGDLYSWMLFQTVFVWDPLGEASTALKNSPAFGGRSSGTFFWKRLGAPKFGHKPKRMVMVRK